MRHPRASPERYRCARPSRYADNRARPGGPSRPSGRQCSGADAGACRQDEPEHPAGPSHAGAAASPLRDAGGSARPDDPPARGTPARLEAVWAWRSWSDLRRDGPIAGPWSRTRQAGRGECALRCRSPGSPRLPRASCRRARWGRSPDGPHGILRRCGWSSRVRHRHEFSCEAAGPPGAVPVAIPAAGRERDPVRSWRCAWPPHRRVPAPRC